MAAGSFALTLTAGTTPDARPHRIMAIADPFADTKQAVKPEVAKTLTD